MVVGWESGKAGVADAATKKKENKNTTQEKNRGERPVIHLTPGYLNPA